MIHNINNSCSINSDFYVIHSSSTAEYVSARESICSWTGPSAMYGGRQTKVTRALDDRYIITRAFLSFSFGFHSNPAVIFPTLQFIGGL